MVILSKFAENLLELMQEKKLNAPALGKILNTNRTSIGRYLRGERFPDYELFVALVEYFNVSADVLLGRQDYSDTKTFNPVQPFGVTLRRVLEEAKTSQYRLQTDLHLSSATTYAWLYEEQLPSIQHIDQLADYLEVSVDYLLGRIS